jgi:hypothetical protein
VKLSEAMAKATAGAQPAPAGSPLPTADTAWFELHADEKILWHGQPASSLRAGPLMWLSALVAVVLAFFAALVAPLLYIVIVMAIASIVLAQFVWFIPWRVRYTRYALTDQRVVISAPRLLRTPRVVFMPVQNVEPMEIERHPDGSGTVGFAGQSVRETKRFAMFGEYGGEGGPVNQPWGFAEVEGIDTVVELARANAGGVRMVQPGATRLSMQVVMITVIAIVGVIGFGIYESWSGSGDAMFESTPQVGSATDAPRGQYDGVVVDITGAEITFEHDGARHTYVRSASLQDASLPQDRLIEGSRYRYYWKRSGDRIYVVGASRIAGTT